MDRRKGPRVNDLSKEAFKRVKAFIGELAIHRNIAILT